MPNFCIINFRQKRFVTSQEAAGITGYTLGRLQDWRHKGGWMAAWTEGRCGVPVGLDVISLRLPSI
ncbi:hypothetical protein [Kamptonema formosum]|uniref:hypothetical protein n=1 Tax=Kamptonema formosum TaxID=331992 RepID=UPI0003783DC8|nr:hypothetical protein [Oscillatoria sp. PCC 10802]